VIEAVVFDLDGVLLDSEQVWDEVREELVKERGGRWHDRAQTEMMGMSSIEWSRYMHDELGVPDPPREISADVVRRLEEVYRQRLPLIDGAHEAVERLAARWPRGKPEPDVYLEAARGLGVPPERCAAVEDSHNGIRSAKAAGMRVIAIPNQHYPPGEEALALADVTLSSLAELTPSIVA